MNNNRLVSFIPFKSQKGIGLVEVIVALLLLAVAVLGFSAMQMTAVKATDESLMRTRALNVMRGGAEIMRANPTGITAFKDAINSSNTSVTSDGVAISLTNNSCLTGGSPESCSVSQLATRDALTIKDNATKSDMKIALLPCPGTSGAQERQCFVTSWGSTEPKLDTSDNACGDANGSYNSQAQCFIMEAY